MLARLECIIVLIFICGCLLTSSATENQYPDVIATYRGPFQDPPFSPQVDKFYEEKIPCDLIMEPMETVRTALNQLEVLRRSYCNKQNASEKDPINVPIKPAGSRSSGIPESDDSDSDNKGIDLLAVSRDNDIKMTENPNVLSTTIEDNSSTTRRRTFFRKAKKRCPSKKFNRYHVGRRGAPYFYYEYYNDHESHDEYYEDEYYYNNNKK